MNEYEKQGNDFLEQTGTEMEVEFIEFGLHFPGDKDKRDIYEITLTKGNQKHGYGSYTFRFGQSIADSGVWYDRLKKQRVSKERARQLGGDCQKIKRKEPTAYDIFSCLTKHDPGLFEDFCNEYGADADSRTYRAVRDEYLNLAKLYNDAELEKMAEIQ